MLGSVTLPGWAGFIERSFGVEYFSSYLHDSTVAIAMALLCFLIPGEPDSAGRRTPDGLGDRGYAPLGHLACSLAAASRIAQAFRDSGLSVYLGEAFAARDPTTSIRLAMTAVVCLLLTF